MAKKRKLCIDMELYVEEDEVIGASVPDGIIVFKNGVVIHSLPEIVQRMIRLIFSK
jgi:hypothetical protein